MAYLKRMPLRKSVDFIIVQIAGGLSGVILSHLMFYHEIPIILQVSEKARNGGNYLGELIGTTILLLTILILIKYDNPRISWNIGFLVGGQLMATSSTMFVNPMITIARTFTYSEAGIGPTDSIIFISMQLISIIISVFYIGKFMRNKDEDSSFFRRTWKFISA